MLFVIFSGQILNAQQKIVKPSLRGSKKSQARQNVEAAKEGLTRLQGQRQLERMKRQKLLVPLPSNSRLQVDSRIPETLRYCRPWTKAFLLRFAEDFHRQFKNAKPIEVNSAVRTEAYQRRLRKHNSNAARKSSHVVGSTVDLGKLGHTGSELKYMRGYLLRLEKAGVVEVTEEHSQSVFHVMVFKNYPQYEKRRQVRKRAKSIRQSRSASPLEVHQMVDE